MVFVINFGLEKVLEKLPPKFHHFLEGWDDVSYEKKLY
jgi:hypothetical protein